MKKNNHHEAITLHELSCIRCEHKEFKVIILRINKGSYGISWACIKCEASQIIIPIEGVQAKKIIETELEFTKIKDDKTN